MMWRIHGFVASDQLVIIVGTPAAIRFLLGPRGLALVAIGRVVALHELVEVFALQRIGLEREVFVDSKVVDPDLLGPRCLARRLLVEKENVGLHALGIKEAGRQA